MDMKTGGTEEGVAMSKADKVKEFSHQQEDSSHNRELGEGSEQAIYRKEVQRYSKQRT